jgi:hypothetical protein
MVGLKSMFYFRLRSSRTKRAAMMSTTTTTPAIRVVDEPLLELMLLVAVVLVD